MHPRRVAKPDQLTQPSPSTGGPCVRPRGIHTCLPLRSADVQRSAVLPMRRHSRSKAPLPGRPPAATTPFGSAVFQLGFLVLGTARSTKTCLPSQLHAGPPRASIAPLNLASCSWASRRADWREALWFSSSCSACRHRQNIWSSVADILLLSLI